MPRNVVRLPSGVLHALTFIAGVLAASSSDGVSQAKPAKGPAQKVQFPAGAPREADVPPQDFLVRSQYLSRGATGIKQALDYRLSEYTQIRPVSFFGLGVMLHQALHQPLHCVQRLIEQTCKQEYRPKVLSGWRPYNTYKEAKDWNYQEYSNHIFGLALDIDPDLNPCCGCVKDWAKSERCKQGAKDMGPGHPPLGRHELPECWIDAFKHYGFHWLGDDKGLRDTMHFEFLAAPGSVSCEAAKP